MRIRLKKSSIHGNTVVFPEKRVDVYLAHSQNYLHIF